MKGLMALLLLLGLSMPVMADGTGENSDAQVNCESIFQGKGEGKTPEADTGKADGNTQKEG
ncbi:hypothetical protein A9Q84_21665 [Halobacteriovorax marinus]|uniref:Secreted protein n=1 Tax=Halobacteriovorax marinus TaxID=97084 RepID=A0A1Y5F899_9BACT|nr:hypothetical protein A9Q84_21665 [Halobacteriovorax marinus]